VFPTLLYASASDSSSLEFVRYINSVIIIIIIIQYVHLFLSIVQTQEQVKCKNFGDFTITRAKV